MDNIDTLFTLLLAQLLTAMSPGPNTVMVLNNAFYGRRFGIATAAGIWPIGILWSCLSFLGVGTVLLTAPGFLFVLHWLCGGYLLWLGYKAIRNSFAKKVRYHDSGTAIANFVFGFPFRCYLKLSKS